ncbi:Zn-ribbon domain-containing OB-fold protein [Leptospira meyeri]|uniref:Zn-ribbon domain-containing OB-fold protein n=1 Tax=Leptospira meyeri TaxID=29508 RepID=UPI000C29C6F8|nr:OB-fold domain-containing protein [Leptospira meyeri]PKA24534.1 hypothetical protein CH381_20305 [Leptospira sp. mixed culture ATI2-C-A1]MCW7488316.1 OB-fold domain-containing protein [Leptospira meyeri]PJZ79815.1 hypothetical protein CH359_16535 [Leptospira meyeri]PJZ95348.1 hypothetical protein CH358_18010 [Leptospira meyeri]PKA11776.1 hypothetical protein CH372_12390 [Leptospira meyeri]
MNVIETFPGIHCKQCDFKVAEQTSGCPSCGSESIESVNLKPNGIIHSFTVVYVGFGHMATRAPYVLAIVQTEENVKLTTVVEGVTDFSTVKIGDKVRFKAIDEKIGPVFQY